MTMDSGLSLPTVSVTLACYNGERFLSQQLDSVLNQTHKQLEIVVIDDASSDGTKRILQDYCKKDSRIRLYENEHNLGYNKTFEKCMLLSIGEYIAPCDQDDVWQHDKIETLLNTLSSNDLIYSDSELIDTTGELLNKRLSDRKEMNGFDDCLTYIIGGSAPGHGMLFRRQVFQRCLPFPENIPFDYWLGYVATLTRPIIYFDQVLVQYRQHDSNLFGVSVQGKKHRRSGKKQSNEKLRRKMQVLYEKCPDDHPRKPVLRKFMDSYQSFSLISNVQRMTLFLRYRDKVVLYKKKPAWRKWLFCLKTFFTLQ